jgi:hypothetical protein
MKRIAMFQLGLFLVILTSLVMPDIQTLIGLSWNIKSSISTSFVYSPFSLLVNLAYQNIITSCKLLLNVTSNRSLRSILKFSTIIWVSVLGMGLFQEWRVFQMLTSSWLKLKCLNQRHCASPHNPHWERLHHQQIMEFAHLNTRTTSYNHHFVMYNTIFDYYIFVFKIQRSFVKP